MAYKITMKLSDYLEGKGPDGSRMTHREFGALIGVSQTAVTRYVNGERVPRKQLLRKIAEATQNLVTPNDFVDGLTA